MRIHKVFDNIGKKIRQRAFKGKPDLIARKSKARF